MSRWAIPFSRQIRSNSTSPPCPNRSVNCLPLSVSTSSGTPNVCKAPAKAAQTARPVARSTICAITQYREWSSTPVTTLASASSPVTGLTSMTPPTMSICHNCIGRSRCQRLKSDRFRRRTPGSISPCRTRIR